MADKTNGKIVFTLNSRDILNLYFVNTENFCAFSSVKFEHFHRLFLTSLNLSYRFFAFLSICNFSHVCLLSPNGEAICQVKRILLPHLQRPSFIKFLLIGYTFSFFIIKPPFVIPYHKILNFRL